ncbi:hypothetical protein EDE15_1051 [Edaphobacter aggregans]|uniref:Uncharacterized protein n=1 Tax=Edaphobacter aggregans TaxID=570835 RepID=A0A3R9PQF2_9BACT|nr:hypothetical protein [Edaphobacter aggregans]RSL15560.1 hypothetical protein EDE15_1051 [Edaphobacter aggregans]
MTTKKQLQRESEARKAKRLAHLGIWIGVTSLVIGVIALWAFWPGVTVSISDPVDPNNPFSASVTVTNNGHLPLTSVRPSFGLGKITYGDPNRSSTYESSEDYAAMGSEEWHPRDLGTDEKFEVALNEVWPDQLGPLLSAELAIMVEYRIPIIHWRRFKSFPYKAKRQTNGHFYWYSDANKGHVVRTPPPR